MDLKENYKIQLALSSIMFFSPIIKKYINQENIIEKEKKFINGYIQIGILNLFILAIIILSGITSLFSGSEFILKLYNTSTITLAIIISLEIILILSNTDINILSIKK
ncbi:hypothetical protein K9M48_05585 [Candidatus Gracilibacteria bacterium]|nr:hypothetical protein [Candidatus Gracilibacteria bacterium]